MRKRILSLGLVGGALLAAQVVQAHELSCDKTVNGATYVEVSSYPATLHYELTINNTSPEYGSDVLTASDPMLEAQGFSFSPAVPFSLGLGESVSDTFDVALKDEADCLAMASTDGTVDDLIDNVFETSWESGTAQCTASVKCLRPPPPASGATRTMGFYKTHEQALSECIVELPLEVDLASALGVLWASPAVYDSGGKRTEIDRDRVLLGRQLLTAHCNSILFGTEPQPSTLLSDALSAAFGDDCANMLDYAAQLDEFNNSGDDQPFPAGFDPGPATPRDAQSKAVDPMGESSDHCG